MSEPTPCRALRVLCAAPDRERLAALKRAAVSAEWELVGEATSLAELEEQIPTWEPHVVVLDGSLGPEVVARIRELLPSARIVTVGDAPGIVAEAATLEDVRSAILGVPREATTGGGQAAR